jgi:hypothetical protein
LKIQRLQITDARTNNNGSYLVAAVDLIPLPSLKTKPHQNITTVAFISMPFYPYSDAFSGIRSRKLIIIKMLLFL